MVMLARGLGSKLKQVNHAADLRKTSAPRWTDPRLRTDDDRSTWWCASGNQNFKFIRWINNELIRASIVELVKAGVLDAKATDRKVEQVIEELIEKIYEE